ncbi:MULTISPECIES: hypothetical protein [Frankia]|nr:MULTISPECIES: hypothetical protein [Frankia]
MVPQNRSSYQKEPSTRIGVTIVEREAFPDRATIVLIRAALGF